MTVFECLEERGMSEASLVRLGWGNQKAELFLYMRRGKVIPRLTANYVRINATSVIWSQNEVSMVKGSDFSMSSLRMAVMPTNRPPA